MSKIFRYTKLEIFINKIILLSKNLLICRSRDWKLAGMMLALSILITTSAHAQDVEQSYQREMEQAIAEMDMQSKNSSTITMPALSPTGSAMYDKAAQINLLLTVELRREIMTEKTDAWKNFVFDTVKDDFNFLAKPDQVEIIYMQLDEWDIELRKHLSAYENICAKFKNSIRELIVLYGAEAKMFSSPLIDEMSIKYPAVMRRLSYNFEKLIQYAHLNAGKIKPSQNGLVAMQTKAETLKILALIGEFGESVDQFQHLTEREWQPE